MIRDRNFYKQFFAMAIVLVLQNVITISVNLADNIMLGAYSETSLAGAAAVNQIQFVYQCLLLSFGDGVAIIGGQYFGKGEIRPIRQFAGIAMRLGLALQLILFLAVTAFPHAVLSAFTTDGAIIAEGMRYLSLVRFTYVFFAVTQMLLAKLRAVGDVRIALRLSVLALVLNCTINYTLIYGHFGAPRMGIAGAAVGTLTARIVEMAVVIIHILRRKPEMRLSAAELFDRDAARWKKYIRVTLPILFIGGMWGFNLAAQNMILGHLDARAIAANSVASTLFTLVKSFAIGMSTTAAFFTAKTIGEGDREKLRTYARTMQVLFVLVGVVSGIVLFLIRIPILRIYDLSGETRAMANSFLLILSVIVVTMSYQMSTNSGIMKGGGDTKYFMILDLVSIWGITIPLSLLAAFYFHASPTTVLWCLNADQVFKGIPAFIRCNFSDWAHVLTE